MPDDWSKLSGAIFSRASDALNEAKQLKDSMSQPDRPAIDWSKLSDSIVSRASGALNEAKKLWVSLFNDAIVLKGLMHNFTKDSSKSPTQDMTKIDRSKLSGAIVSRASGALNEAKKLKDSTPTQDMTKIDWSKLSDTIISRASGALNEAKKLKDSTPTQDMTKIDWSKLSGAIVSSVSDALNEVKQFGLATLFIEDSVSESRIDLPHMDWSKFSNAFHAVKQSNFVSTSRDWSFAMANTFHQQLWRLIEMSYNIPLPKLWATISPYLFHAHAIVKEWLITHPYAAGGLLFTLGCMNPVIFLTPLQILWITGNIASRMCLLPMHIPVRLLGFMGQGVNKGSLAALYQSRVLGGYVPRGSVFAGLQSFGATVPSVGMMFICLLAGTGVVLFLARN